jgi:hypothetical protein
MAFSEQAGVERPWGAWLRQREDGLYEDAEGRTFRTVRRCFLETRLRMTGASARDGDEILELLLAVLVAHARGRSTGDLEIDLFDGSGGYRTFVQNWLEAEGFVAPDRRTWSGSHRLTDEGAAVMRMLMISRPHATVDTSIGTDAIALVRALHRVVGPSSSRMAAVEAASAGMKAAFIRDGRRDDHVVALVRRDGEGDMPLTRTVFACSFDTEEARDRFFGWLCDHVDRWWRWSEMAWRHGGTRLLQHLLGLVASGLPPDSVMPPD